jgi:alpha-L-arabinofuranosidase
MHKKIFTCALALTAALTASAQSHVMNINTKKIGAPIQSTMYGEFFEDINFAADGGLYAEKIMNRSFEFPNPLEGWVTCGKVSVREDGPFDKNPHYVRLDPAGHRERKTVIENHGFFGIGIIKGETYRVSLWARCPKGGESQLWIDLVDNASMDDTQLISNGGIKVSGKEWKKYTVEITSKKTLEKAAIRLYNDANNTTDIEHFSMFPKETFNGHENGLRKDLAQALKDINPGVFRFPGGCIVEGVDLATRYQWKNTVGPVENRPLNENRWQSTFTSRLYPNYYQSYGLGFYEYFLLSEEIGAEPLPVLNCGMACQFQNPGDAHNAHGDELEQYIQDCIDLVEFANGGTDTKWGKLRAEMGHPEPFNLKYLGVGNEQWDDIYYDRMKQFMPRLRKAIPNIKIIGTSGPDSEGPMFDKGWKAMKDLKVDLVDEHFYRNEQWFLSHGDRYEKYDRKGPKVFAGEYACHGKGKKWNHYETAILEAAQMTDYERNADVVYMATYAPLFAHVEGWQWRPDLIWFNNNKMFKSVSYYVQQIFGQNKGTNMLKITMNDKIVGGFEGQDGLFASTVYDKDSNSVFVKVVNTSDKNQTITVNLKGMKGERTADVISLYYADRNAENTLDEPNKIVPSNSTLKCEAGKANTVLNDELKPMSFKLYKIKK